MGKKQKKSETSWRKRVGEEALKKIEEQFTKMGIIKNYLTIEEDDISNGMTKEEFINKISNCTGIPLVERTVNIPFGIAIEALKKGKTIVRKDWDRCALILTKGGFNFSKEIVTKFKEPGYDVFINPFMAIVTDNDVSVYNPSQEDILAEDWMIL